MVVVNTPLLQPKRRTTPLRGVLRGLLAASTTLMVLGLSACSGRRYEPSLATRPYPVQLDQDRIVDVQMFRDGGNLIVTNASPQSFIDFDVWVNRRYMMHIDRLNAGETRTFWFGDFFDMWGESPVAGGFFRTEAPTPIVLVQIQIGEDTPLLGAISVPEEDRF